jgi:hypothetical protein
VDWEQPAPQTCTCRLAHISDPLLPSPTAKSATMICSARPVAKASVAKAFAPKARIVRRTGGAVKVQAYTITLETPSGTESFECDDSTFILDAAEVRCRHCPHFWLFLLFVIGLVASRAWYCQVQSAASDGGRC